jgi:hypothetical protein
MEPLIYEGTSKTPAVIFNADSGKFEIKGRSIPENSIDFYKPLLAWFDKYSEYPNQTTEIIVQLEYFNTSSSKCILDLFKKFEIIYKKGDKEIIVNWYYDEEDEDMLEAGEDYKSIIKIPFKMIKSE